MYIELCVIIYFVYLEMLVGGPEVALEHVTEFHRRSFR